MHPEEPGTPPNGGNGSDCGCDRSRGEPDPEEVQARVREAASAALPRKALETTHLYLDPMSVPKGTQLGPSFEPWVADRDYVLCFADFEPHANFAHACSYFLHDPGSGKLVRRVAAQFPPWPMQCIHLMELFHEAKPPVETQTRQARPRPEFARRMDHALMRRAPARPRALAAGRRYAILFSGVSDPHHLNDLELCLRMLTDTFGFARSDIFVLFQDGTDTGTPFLNKQRQKRTWPGATSAPDNQFRLKPDGKGSRKAFKAVLAKLAGDMQPNDLLYIHTEGHGGIQFGTGGGQYLYCIPDGPDSTDRYFDFQMQSDLQQVRGYDSLLVVMNQCFSGGFMDSVLAGSKAQRTFFAAACAGNKLAYATPDLRWNRFSRNWIEREQTQDPDGKVEAREAYDYCDDADVRGPDTPLDGRMPPPGSNGQSPADAIVLR